MTIRPIFWAAAVCIMLCCVAGEPAQAQMKSASGRLGKSGHADVGRGNEVHVNRIHLAFSNAGGLEEGWDAPISWWVNGWGGLDEARDFIFDQAVWVTGKRNGLLGSLPFNWGSPYAPGPVINGQPGLKARPQDSLRYKVYSIMRGETSDMNPDLAAWPADLGAPVDAQMQPRVLGDQTLWTIYNGVDPTVRPHLNYVSTPSPQIVLPIEIHQTVFAHFGDVIDTSVWANTAFFEWAIYNRGDERLDSVYLTLWTDPDLIDPYRTGIGVDTIAQTGYGWYLNDPAQGCVGYSLLYGPAVASSAADTATFFGQKRAGYKNMRLTSFWPFRDDSYLDRDDGPPFSLNIIWNVVRGLMPHGAPIIDSVTRRPTTFPYSGDPLTRTGSVCPWTVTGGGAGFMMTVGPVTLAPRDSQWIMMALIPGMTWNGTDAIMHMRMNANYLRSLPYDSLVAVKSRRDIPAQPLPVFTVPGSFALHQNYPNPFNNATTIDFDLPERSHVRLEVFDVLGRTVAVLADDTLERGIKTISWYPQQQASGMYVVRIKAESLESAQKWNALQKVVLAK